MSNFQINVVFFLVTYLFPMLGMVTCYLKMGLHLWQGDRETMGAILPHSA